MSGPLVFLNGLFRPLEKASVSILDRGFCYGDGVFETMRAYGAKIFRLDCHLDRLLDSLPLIFLDLPMTRKELAQAIHLTLEKNRFEEAIVRLTVTRGEQLPGLHLDSKIPPTVVIHARAFAPPPRQWYEDGVTVELFPDSAYRTSGLRRGIKSCNFLSYIVIREKAARKGAQEGILMRGGETIAEGTSSNLFLVERGILKTPRLNESILPGVTRQVVIELAHKMGLPCLEQSLTEKDVIQADEVFLTNTGVEILPVRQAGGRAIGSGKPGPMTQALRREFRKTIEG